MLPGFFKQETTIATRDVNVSEIGTLSYEDKIDELTDNFENIEVSNEGEISHFSGDIVFEEVDYLSTSGEKNDIVDSYKAEINNVEENISIESTIIIDGEVEQNISLNYDTYYDEANDKYYFVDENGNKTDIMATLESENFQECFFFTAIISAISVKMIAAAVVAVAATGIAVAFVNEHSAEISNAVNTLVQGVRDGFTSFWERLRLRWGAITAIALSGAIALTQNLAIELYETAKNRKGQYLLCGSITGSGFIPVLYKFTNYENARNWIKKGGSVWSPFSHTATRCIEGAGYVPGVIKNGAPKLYEAEIHDISPFAFAHYHALIKRGYKKVKGAHSFFGLPFIR